jgi:hypothetical protein
MRRPTLQLVPTRPRGSDVYGGIAIIAIFIVSVVGVLFLITPKTKLAVSADLGRASINEMGR